MSGKGPDLEVYSDFEHCSHFADAKFGYNDAPYHRPNSQALTKHDIMGYKMLGMWRVTPHLRFIEIKYILSNLLPPKKTITKNPQTVKKVDLRWSGRQSEVFIWVSFYSLKVQVSISWQPSNVNQLSAKSRPGLPQGQRKGVTLRLSWGSQAHPKSIMSVKTSADVDHI